MDEDDHHGLHMVELAVVCSGAVLGQRPPPPRLLARATANHLKGGDSQVTPLQIHGRRPQEPWPGQGGGHLGAVVGGGRHIFVSLVALVSMKPRPLMLTEDDKAVEAFIICTSMYNHRSFMIDFRSLLMLVKIRSSSRRWSVSVTSLIDLWVLLILVDPLVG